MKNKSNIYMTALFPVLLLMICSSLSYASLKADYYPQNIRITKSNKIIYSNDFGKTWKVEKMQINEADLPRMTSNKFIQIKMKYLSTWTKIEKISNGLNSKGLTSIYPNPSAESIKVDFNIDRIETYEIGIYNISGKLYMMNCINNLKLGKNSIETDISTLPSGYYFIVLKSNSTIKTYNFSIIN